MYFSPWLLSASCEAASQSTWHLHITILPFEETPSLINLHATGHTLQLLLMAFALASQTFTILQKVAQVPKVDEA